jgi:hypothetical protein
MFPWIARLDFSIGMERTASVRNLIEMGTDEQLKLVGISAPEDIIGTFKGEGRNPSRIVSEKPGAPATLAKRII